MRRGTPLGKGLWWSVLLHGGGLVLMVTGLPFWSPKPLPSSSVMTVDIVRVGPVTQASTPLPASPAQKLPPQASPQQPPSEPAASRAKLASREPEGAPVARQPSALQPSLVPKSPLTPPADRPSLPPKASNKPQKPSSPSTTEGKPPMSKTKAQKEKGIGALLAPLNETKESPSSSLDQLMNDATPGAQGAAVGEATITEQDLIRQEIYRWWNEPLVARRTGVQVMVEIHLTPEGRVKEFSVLHALGTPGHEHYALTLETAERALKHPQLRIPLPPERYSLWQTLKFKFEPT